jgi:hypothetical protein
MNVLPRVTVSFVFASLLVAQEAAAATGPSRSSGSTWIVWVVIGAVALVVLGVTAEMIRRILQHGGGNSPTALFYGLCRAHGMDRSARTLLWDVACLHNLAQPARVFTEPRWLDPAVLQNCLGARTAEAAALHAQLFAGCEDGDGPSR